MNYKKIIPAVIALGMFTFGGLGCTKDPQKEPIDVEEYKTIVNQTKGNQELRQKIYGYLDSKPYSVNTDKHKITTEIDSSAFGWCSVSTLTVTIRNKSTGDTLELKDYNIDGDVDWALYNGLTNGTEGMEERFDKALELIKPGLEQKVKKQEEEQKQTISKVRDNTKL